MNKHQTSVFEESVPSILPAFRECIRLGHAGIINHSVWYPWWGYFDSLLRWFIVSTDYLLENWSLLGVTSLGISASLSGEISILYSADSMSPRHSCWGAKVCQDWAAWHIPITGGRDFNSLFRQFQCRLTPQCILLLFKVAISAVCTVCKVVS